MEERYNHLEKEFIKTNEKLNEKIKNMEITYDENIMHNINTIDYVEEQQEKKSK
jgi:hypothetical protein